MQPHELGRQAQLNEGAAHLRHGRWHAELDTAVGVHRDLVAGREGFLEGAKLGVEGKDVRVLARLDGEGGVGL